MFGVIARASLKTNPLPCRRTAASADHPPERPSESVRPFKSLLADTENLSFCRPFAGALRGSHPAGSRRAHQSDAHALSSPLSIMLCLAARSTTRGRSPSIPACRSAKFTFQQWVGEKKMEKNKSALTRCSRSGAFASCMFMPLSRVYGCMTKLFQWVGGGVPERWGASDSTFFITGRCTTSTTGGTQVKRSY